VRDVLVCRTVLVREPRQGFLPRPHVQVECQVGRHLEELAALARAVADELNWSCPRDSCTLLSCCTWWPRTWSAVPPSVHAPSRTGNPNEPPTP
jgi:hypothetical protein